MQAWTNTRPAFDPCMIAIGFAVTDGVEAVNADKTETIGAARIRAALGGADGESVSADSLTTVTMA